MSDLKPCPFCGYSHIRPPRDENGAICPRCGTEGFGDWNTRPIEDALLTRAETAERELAELRERTRWHLDPDDLPRKEYVVIVLLDDGQIKDDLICFNGTWLSNDNVIGWREADFPALPEPPEADRVGNE